MGRYYNGTIAGKFWFSIQSSYDPEYFKKEPNTYKEVNYYYSCSCYVENNKKPFCLECYLDYDDHYNSLDEIDKSDVSKYGNPLYYSSNQVKYIFDSDELEFVNQILNELENQIGSSVINELEFKIDEENDFEYEINNDIFDKYDNQKELLELIARWCIGQQIKKAIEVNGDCDIFCEI
jgi:hypothetical protein